MNLILADTLTYYRICF